MIPTGDKDAQQKYDKQFFQEILMYKKCHFSLLKRGRSAKTIHFNRPNLKEEKSLANAILTAAER